MGAVRKTIKTFNVFGNTQFNRFLKKNPQYKKDVPKLKDFRKLLELVQNEIVEEMKRNTHGVILPDSQCVLFINNCGESKKRPVNYNLTKKYGKTIYYTNIDTDMNVMKITYLNKALPSAVENIELYSFFAKRDFKKKCSEFFKNNWQTCLAYKRNRYGNN